MAQLNTRIVSRNDSSANWAANSTVVLLKGEIGIEFTADGKIKQKVGDGTKTWAQLPYFGGEEPKTFQVGSLDEITDTDLAVGDTAIVKKLISGDKYSYTGYVYNGEAWAAMDGNYNANNVYFDKDLTFTTAIGTLKPDASGSGTLSAAGKSVNEVLSAILAKEANPTTTQPSVSISSTTANGYEVGSTVTPAYSATFNEGKYSYDSSTGVSVTSWVIKDSDNNTAETASGSMPQLVVTDATNYTITATANYGAGNIPKTNLGNDYAAGQIKAGNKSATSGKIYGYRNTFYGTKTTKDALDSDAIRLLAGKSNKALANGNGFTVAIPVGAVRVVFAYPATLRDVTSVKDVNGLNAVITSAFTKSTMTVKGAGSDAGIEYKVYTTDFAEPVAKANSYTVTI